MAEIPDQAARFGRRFQTKPKWWPAAWWLGIVLPDNVLSADSYEYVREWLRKKVCVRVILGLPVETFSPFGANVKTSILFARKWRSGETPNESAKVCLQKIEAVGYDASGRLTKKSDIPEAISTACAFLKNNGW